jgi:Type II secretion system (T2SS), protein M subtype b
MPTGRNGQLWGLILILTTSAGVYLMVVVPLVDLSPERQSVLENQRVLPPRLEAAADKLLKLRAPASARKVTAGGSSDATASADLQSHIEELATPVDATISSTKGIPAEVHGSCHLLVGSHETWVRLFGKLEAATPPLVIDNLHIHGGLRVDGRTGRPRAPGLETPTLNAGPDLCGFRTNENLAVVKP